MKTFITQKKIDGEIFAGQEIQAKSWNKAREKAKTLGLEVIGILQDVQEPA